MRHFTPHPVPDATLARLIRPTNPSRRPDKAFTPHPAPGA
ncbi:mannitol-1-phosphate 5-dehydrogenase [Escherichia coli]|nr:mannitol-1-phosphate 5-dehydrogenase [Escherichia coli]OOH74616.1 mannitol-1-phosphate 5-dehydrogenase [Escherichia coli]OUK96610.1 mannitol-1-phosphate 5-dehydrogenase [Escherichia coli]OUL01385.1 mannitol-1-phosphate 5-dehydrogenase [Escherichia coli]